MESAPTIDGDRVGSKRPPSLVRVQPRYVRLRQGSEIRYHLKLLRAPSKGKGVTVHVCVTMAKCGISVQPAQLVITASDWRLPREVCITSDLDAEVRTVQIFHKINENIDDAYRSNTIIPSVFVSVLQKEATFLFAFGCGLHGRLGTPEEINSNTPTPFSSRWLHPVQISCGKAHSAIIDVYSNLYCFGNNVNGQLGQGDSNLDPSRLPLRVPSVGTGNVLQVACGSNHTMCMTTEGKIFGWGDNTFGQLGIGFKSPKARGTPLRVEKVMNLRQIYCGGNQSFLVALDNNVLACGSNIAGQLGTGDRVDRVLFERIPFFRKLCASTSATNTKDNLSQPQSCPLMGEVELACGPYHTLALCAKLVYSWGIGDDGRLGHGNLETCLEPTPIPALREVPVRHIACGGSHSGALAQNGEVYTWGCGQYGQLGIGTTRNRRVPTKVRLLHDKHVSQLSFGEWHSMILCEDGTLYAWGFGEEGQLGLPEDVRQHEARIVTFPTIVSALSGTGATIVRCGAAHTFVVSVLESRRPQLATLHRRASKMEILKEKNRLETLDRQKSRRVHGVIINEELDRSEGHETTKEMDHQGRLSEPWAATSPKSALETSRKATTRKSNQSSRRYLPPRQGRHADAEESDDVLWSLDSTTWKDRPMTSRLSVRNACRQEMRAVAELKAMSPPPTQVPRKQAFVSPRLARLHEQVTRSSEAGVAAARAMELVEDHQTKTEIEWAVACATTSLWQPSELIVARSQITTGANSRGSNGLNFTDSQAVETLYAPVDDDDGSDDQIEDVSRCPEIEAEIRRTAVPGPGYWVEE